MKRARRLRRSWEERTHLFADIVAPKLPRIVPTLGDLAPLERTGR